MTDVETILEDAETTPAIRSVLDYHRGRGAPPWPANLVRAVEQTGGRLCLRRATTSGFCTVFYRRGRWRCSEYDHTLDRSHTGPISRQTVANWVEGVPPELETCEEIPAELNVEATWSDGGRAAKDDTTTLVAVRLELESVVRTMTNIDWSLVPEVSAIEAATWTVRLVEARDSLATEESYVTAGELDASANENWGVTARSQSEEDRKNRQTSSQRW